MSGAATEPTRAAKGGDLSELQRSFRVFTQVSQDLERVYSRLESRAAVVESRLMEGNRWLTVRVAELSAETDELQGILEAIPCGVVVCDDGGNVTLVNPAAERILGRSAKELIGRNAGTLRGPGGQSVLLLGQDSVPAGQTVERDVAALDGSARFLSGSVAPLAAGGHLEILTDQTEVAHLRSQINRLDTLAALGEMAAGVAHEIRNPMNGVEGFAGLLEKSLEPDRELSREKLLRYTDRIRKGIAEVNGIISNLLLWARPEKARFQRVLLSELVEDVRRDMYEARQRHSCKCLEIDLPDREVSISGDRLKLKIALGNLVRNAVEAVPRGGRVRVSVNPGPQSVSIDVDDEGPGVEPAVRARLFQPFTTTKPTGTGLGLAIVRKLIDLHRGDVRLGNSPLGGARFSIILPLAEEGAVV